MGVPSSNTNSTFPIPPPYTPVLQWEMHMKPLGGLIWITKLFLHTFGWKCRTIMFIRITGCYLLPSNEVTLFTLFNTVYYIRLCILKKKYNAVNTSSIQFPTYMIYFLNATTFCSFIQCTVCQFSIWFLVCSEIINNTIENTVKCILKCNQTFYTNII